MEALVDYGNELAGLKIVDSVFKFWKNIIIIMWLSRENI